MKELEQIMKDNEKLIYSIACMFKNYSSKEDLYQAGCVGLICAYKKFNPNMNCKFTTYAYPYIMGEMRKLIREDKSLKISKDISSLNYKIEKCYNLLTQKLMHEPSISEIANFLEIPEYCVSEAILSLNTVKSIDEPINSEGKEITLQDVIGKSNDVDDLIMLKENLLKLDNEEQMLIYNRYENDYTQSETAKILGISQVQTSRKEQKILQKLKQEMIINQ